MADRGDGTNNDDDVVMARRESVKRKWYDQ